MDIINTEMVCIHGDNHGEWNKLFNIIDRRRMRDCVLIGVGDTGIGFQPPNHQKFMINELNSSFKERNIRYMSIRGNHCNPSYFDGSVKLTNFELVRDYSYKEINGEKYLFVGGAISVDRVSRIDGETYWKDEIFIFKPELVEECDVLITHSTPTWLGPSDKKSLEYWCSKDDELWEECCKERLEIDKLMDACKAKKSYHGHFHLSNRTDFKNCHSKMLDINEFIQHFNYIDD
jgi:hypothetical protein